MIIGWNANTEKLLCLMALDDDYALRLSPIAGEAFWRAFIKQDRATGAVSAAFRYRYKTKDQWYTLDPPHVPGKEAELAEGIRKDLEKVQLLACEFMGIDPRHDLIRCWFPPDDHGDGMATVEWLKEQDLVEVHVEKTKDA